MAKWLDIGEKIPNLVNLDACTDFRMVQPVKGKAYIIFYVEDERTAETFEKNTDYVLDLMQTIISFIVSDTNYCKLYDD